MPVAQVNPGLIRQGGGSGLGPLLSTLGTVAGTAIGGPLGGAAGGALGSLAGGASPEQAALGGATAALGTPQASDAIKGVLGGAATPAAGNALEDPLKQFLGNSAFGQVGGGVLGKALGFNQGGQVPGYNKGGMAAEDVANAMSKGFQYGPLASVEYKNTGGKVSESYKTSYHNPLMGGKPGGE